MRMRNLVGVALIAAVSLAGCGGGDDSDVLSSATTGGDGAAVTTTAAAGGTSASTTTAKPGSTTTKPTTTTGGGSSSGPTGFCLDWIKAAASIGAVATPSGSGNEMEDGLKQLEAYFAALAKVAPSEIKDDFAVYAEFWRGYAAALAKVDYDFARLMNDPEAMKAFEALSSEKFEKAGDNISAWVEKNCSTGK